MNNNAFSAGVEAGGLISTNQIKLLAAHIINTVGKPIQRELLVDSLQSSGLANYFEATAAVDSLVSSGLAVLTGDLIDLTDNGRTASKELAFTLPVFAKEKAMRTTLSLMMKTRGQNDNTVTTEQADGGVYVTCSINDGDRVLLSTRLFVADMSQAATVQRVFMNNPLKIFSGTLALLTGDFDAVREQFDTDTDI